MSEDAKSPASIGRNKSMEDLKSTDYQTDSNRSLSLDPKDLKNDLSASVSVNSLSRGPSPAQQIQHTMLEKCLRLYELFYVKLVEHRVLDRERSVPELFENLKVTSCKEDFDERTRHLERLLKSKLEFEDSGFFNQELSSPESKPLGKLFFRMILYKIFL